MDEGMAETAATYALIIALQMKRRRRRRRNRCLWSQEWILQCERLRDREHKDVPVAARDSDNKIYASFRRM